MSIVICQECDDAPAVTKRRFNGAGFYDLCQPCADFWDTNDLTSAALGEPSQRTEDE